MTLSQSIVRALRLLREPVPGEKRDLMRARWTALDPRWRTVGQGFGRQATGCGATIGVQPRCDFACAGCYLGADANLVSPAPLDEIVGQLNRLRSWLGPKGNVQITDGEVTLRSAGDLVAILRHARGVGMIPMVMTHGDSFRRRPGLLEQLMIEGGLTEVSIHVDTTQRGRLGYKDVTSERALQPLREEFAHMIRAARRRTGRPLRAATTLTIGRANLADVSHVVEWCLRNRDAFGMLSFQPVAPVGRTKRELAAITVDELWERIDPVLSDCGVARSGRGPLMFGHPDCTRVELFAVYESADGKPRLAPIVRHGHDEDRRMMHAFFERGFGGLNFRDDSMIERICRAAGVLLTDPGWVLGPLRRWTSARLAEVGTSASRLAWDLGRRRSRIDGFSIVSHHFMSAAEVDSDTGRERLAACVFRVPIGGDMVPMCRVNAAGVRDAVYSRQLGT